MFVSASSGASLSEVCPGSVGGWREGSLEGSGRGLALFAALPQLGRAPLRGQEPPEGPKCALRLYIYLGWARM